MPAYVDIVLLALGFVAVVGWLFVGKPARNTDFMASTPAPPQAMGADDAVLVTAVVINRLKIDERHKDLLTRLLVAAVVGAVLVWLHMRLLGLAAT